MNGQQRHVRAAALGRSRDRLNRNGGGAKRPPQAMRRSPSQPRSQLRARPHGLRVVPPRGKHAQVRLQHDHRAPKSGVPIPHPRGTPSRLDHHSRCALRNVHAPSGMATPRARHPRRRRALPHKRASCRRSPPARLQAHHQADGSPKMPSRGDASAPALHSNGALSSCRVRSAMHAAALDGLQAHDRTSDSKQQLRPSPLPRPRGDQRGRIAHAAQFVRACTAAQQRLKPHGSATSLAESGHRHVPPANRLDPKRCASRLDVPLPCHRAPRPRLQPHRGSSLRQMRLALP